MYQFLKDKTVLYIEDELDVLRNIAVLLNKFFHKVYLAEDGEKGLQLFKEKKIDILLIDIEVPKINGIDLIKKIRKTNKSIPIVIISAYTNQDYLLAAIELNLKKFIIKPLTSNKMNELLDILNNHFTDTNEIELTPGIKISVYESVVIFNDKRIKLTKKELEFLTILSRQRAISYEVIYTLWTNNIPTQNAIRTFIKQLRKKLPENTLKTNNDIGYCIESN
jgi:DNA-binding response OmpR family regulator